MRTAAGTRSVASGEIDRLSQLEMALTVVTGEPLLEIAEYAYLWDHTPIAGDLLLKYIDENPKDSSRRRQSVHELLADLRGDARVAKGGYKHVPGSGFQHPDEVGEPNRAEQAR